MAKKDSFNIFNAIDESLLDTLKRSASPIAPTEKEIEIVKQSEGDLRMIPISELRPYHNHTFKVLDNEDMEQLIDSIRDYGILLPLIVRELNGGGFEIISGHRRQFAAKKLGLKEVQCKVMDVDDDMADIIMADTNISRQQILPSEKARTYKVRLEAAIRQGKKSEEELRNIADESTDSLSNIRRYIKLASLSPALLDMVDSDRIPVSAGFVISDFSETDQQTLSDVLGGSDASLTIKKAENLKKAVARGLTKEKAEAIILGNRKARTVKKKQTKFTEDMISDAVPEAVKAMPLDERVEYYKKAIKYYDESGQR